MAWRDRLLPGSFRGVRFGIRSHSTLAGGRRVKPFQYPGRNEPFTEDLGRVADEPEIDGWIVGDDYAARRDALRRASRIEGPGTLVHPYLGIMQVSCTALRLTESSGEGGMVRFSMTFVEAGAPRFPASLRDVLAGLLETVGLAQGSVVDQFAEAFDLKGQVASYVLGELTEVADGLFAKLPDVEGEELAEGQAQLLNARALGRRAVAAFKAAGSARVGDAARRGLASRL